MTQQDSSQPRNVAVTTPSGNKAQERLRKILTPVSHKLWNITLEGFENLPTSGPAILCPNHISFFDSVFTMVFAGRQISFVGKAEYMDSWKT